MSYMSNYGNNGVSEYMQRLMMEQQAQQRPERTALTEFGELLGNMSPNERQDLLRDEAFIGEYGKTIEAFMLFLLTGDAGNAFSKASDASKRQAETLFLTAREASSRKRESMADENMRLKAELEQLRAVNAKGGKNA